MQRDQTLADAVTIQRQFDRIALVDVDRKNYNSRYHGLLLTKMPEDCRLAVELGCGTGAFARLLASHADHVLALDFSQEMIRIAKERSTNFVNIEYHCAEIRDWPFPESGCDFIASIATLHHVQLEPMLISLKAAVRPGGAIGVVDLYQPERLSEHLRCFVAYWVSGLIRLLTTRRLRGSKPVRDAWAPHLREDHYLTISRIREICDRVLPGALVRIHLFWRYSLVWTKPAT